MVSFEGFGFLFKSFKQINHLRLRLTAADFNRVEVQVVFEEFGVLVHLFFAIIVHEWLKTSPSHLWGEEDDSSRLLDDISSIIELASLECGARMLLK